MNLMGAYRVRRARQCGEAVETSHAKCRACGVVLKGHALKYEGGFYHTTWDDCIAAGGEPLPDDRDAGGLTLLSGLIEHGDRGYYFLSTVGVSDLTRLAVMRGWIEEDYTVTEEGREAYERSGVQHIRRGFKYHQFWHWQDVRSVRPPK